MRRMSNEMRELKNEISKEQTKLKDAIAERDSSKCKMIKEVIKDLNELYDSAESIFNDEQGQATDETSCNSGKEQYNANVFFKAISSPGTLSDSEKGLIQNARKKYSVGYQDSFSEGSKENGGYTVPEDISQEILEKIKSEESVRNLVGSEPVKSASGQRIYKNGGATRLYNTAEAEEIKELNNPTYDVFTYNQKKFAGILQISSELLDDSFVNFQAEMTDWMSESSRETENYQILYGAGGEKHCQGLISTVNAYTEITPQSTADITIGYLRKIKFKLGSGYRKNATWVMNTDAFLALSEIEDKNGKSYIQPDPIVSEQYVLLGRPVNIYDSIKTDEGKTVLLFGDFKRAYKMYPRKDFGIAITDTAAGAFETDTMKMRGIERFDGKIIDRNALIVVRDLPVETLKTTTPETDFGVDNIITRETLTALTKEELLEVANEYCIAGLTQASAKATIITKILENIGTDTTTEAGGGE